VTTYIYSTLYMNHTIDCYWFIKTMYKVVFKTWTLLVNKYDYILSWKFTYIRYTHRHLST